MAPSTEDDVGDKLRRYIPKALSLNRRGRHRIELKGKGSGVEVRARREYYVPGPPSPGSDPPKP